LILKRKTLAPGFRRGDVYRVFRYDVGIPILFHHLLARKGLSGMLGIRYPIGSLEIPGIHLLRGGEGISSQAFELRSATRI